VCKTLAKQARPQQLSLGISLADDATFANFYAAPDSPAAQIIHALKYFFEEDSEHCIYMWGATGAGLSHLLQASCHYASGFCFSAQYLPMAELVRFSPYDILDELEDVDLVCLDGIQAIAGNEAWEQALFNFFNRSKDSGRRLLLTADASPMELPVNLPDLQSRLGWGLVFQLPEMSDTDKQQALQMRARARGLELADDVAQFILHRAPRKTAELFKCLDRLDNASLAEQRKLTIPFVKQVLDF